MLGVLVQYFVYQLISQLGPLLIERPFSQGEQFLGVCSSCPHQAIEPLMMDLGSIRLWL